MTPTEFQPREIWWLKVKGVRETKDHRAVILRVEPDAVLVAWGQSVPGDSNDVVVELGKPEARNFHVDRDTYFRLESVHFADPVDFGRRIDECPFRVFGKFLKLLDKWQKQQAPTALPAPAPQPSLSASALPSTAAAPPADPATDSPRDPPKP